MPIREPETLEELKREHQRLGWDYDRACRLIIEKVPPEPLADLLVDHVDNDKRAIVSEIIEYAEQHELPGPFGPFERRALCPLCGASSSSPYAEGFKLPAGLEMHLGSSSVAHQCEVIKAAHHLWDKKHGERVRQELFADMEERRKIRRSKLYQTGPDCKGQEIWSHDRDAVAMEATEARLTASGFEMKVEGPLRSYVKTLGTLAIYADPRQRSSIKFNVYERRRLKTSFTIRDTAKDLAKTVEAKLGRGSKSNGRKEA